MWEISSDRSGGFVAKKDREDGWRTLAYFTSHNAEVVDQLLNRIAALEAKLAEYEQAPTVATVVSDSNRDDYWYTLDAGKLPPIGTELIARPTRKDGE